MKVAHSYLRLIALLVCKIGENGIENILRIHSLMFNKIKKSGEFSDCTCLGEGFLSLNMILSAVINNRFANRLRSTAYRPTVVPGL